MSETTIYGVIYVKIISSSYWGVILHDSIEYRISLNLNLFQKSVCESIHSISRIHSIYSQHDFKIKLKKYTVLCHTSQMFSFGHFQIPTHPQGGKISYASSDIIDVNQLNVFKLLLM